VSLLRLIAGSRSFGEVHVTIDRAMIEQPTGKRTNLERALIADALPDPQPTSTPQPPSTPAPAPSEPMRLPAGLSGKVTLQVQQASYRGGDDPEPYVIDGLEAFADLGDLSAIRASIQTSFRRLSDTGLLDAKLTLYDAVAQDGLVQIQNAQVQADGNLQRLPLPPIDAILKQDGKLTALLGPSIQAKWEAGGTLQAPALKLTAESEHLELSLGLTQQGQVVEADPGSMIRLSLTPSAWAKLLAASQNSPTIKRPIDLQVQLDQLRLPFGPQGIQHEEALLDLGIKAGDFTLQIPGKPAISLSDTALRVESAPLADGVLASFDATMSTGGNIQRVSARLSLNKPSTPETLNITLTSEKLPIPLADALAQLDGKLTETIGDALDTSLNAAISPNPLAGMKSTGQDIAVTGSIESPNLKLTEFSFEKRRDGLIAINTGETGLRFAITPAALSAWAGDSRAKLPVGLDQTLRGTLRFSPVAVSLKPRDDGEMTLDTAGTHGALSLSLPSVALRNTKDETLLPTLQGIELKLDAQNLQQPVELIGSLRVADASTPGRLELHATGRNLFDAAGQPTLDRSVIEATLTSDSLPTTLADQLARQDGMLLAALGERFSPNIIANYQHERSASADITLESGNATASISAQVDLTTPRPTFTFRSDPTVQIAVTRELNRVFLKDLHPAFADVVGSAPGSPVRVQLDKSMKLGFDDAGRLDLKKINATAQLDLGRMLMDRGGWIRKGINDVMSIVVSRWQGRDPSATYLVTFNPVTLTMKDGVVSMSELWLAADDLGVGFQGQVNLNHRTMDIKAGFLGANFVKLAPKLARKGQGLEPSAVYELPITGSLDSPKLDFDRFALQLGKAYAAPDLEKAIGKTGDAAPLLRELLGQTTQAAFGWRNTLTWSPSDEAAAFAVGVEKQLQPPPPATQPGEPNQPATQPASEPPAEQPPQQTERNLQDTIGAFRKLFEKK
jgi:hypothetical protein